MEGERRESPFNLVLGSEYFSPENNSICPYGCVESLLACCYCQSIQCGRILMYKDCELPSRGCFYCFKAICIYCFCIFGQESFCCAFQDSCWSCSIKVTSIQGSGNYSSRSEYFSNWSVPTELPPSHNKGDFLTEHLQTWIQDVGQGDPNHKTREKSGWGAFKTTRTPSDVLLTSVP